MDLSKFPTICRVDANASKLEPFKKANPIHQEDFPKDATPEFRALYE